MTILVAEQAPRQRMVMKTPARGGGGKRGTKIQKTSLRPNILISNALPSMLKNVAENVLQANMGD